jgi:3-oxoacid CoA-transferase subunit A
MAIRPVYATAAEAIADIPDGAMIAMGGFSATLGLPQALLRAVADDSTAKDLTFIGNGIPQGYTGNPEQPWFVVDPARVKKVICSFPAPSSRAPGRTNPYEIAFADGTTELELVPQGTLAERLRAGGAGIPAFFTRTGAGTSIADGKEEREFDGERYIMERGIVADLSIVHAWMGDHEGNLVYRKTARNFNPMMATAGKVTVAEVEHLVRPGELDPDHIITPGVYVKRIIHVPNAVKHIEQRTVRKREAAAATGEEV